MSTDKLTAVKHLMAEKWSSAMSDPSSDVDILFQGSFNRNSDEIMPALSFL